MSTLHGSNIKPGSRPGGFSQLFGAGKTRSSVNRRKVTMAQVRSAAVEALARRGASDTPDMIFDSRGALSR